MFLLFLFAFFCCALAEGVEEIKFLQQGLFERLGQHGIGEYTVDAVIFYRDGIGERCGVDHNDDSNIGHCSLFRHVTFVVLVDRGEMESLGRSVPDQSAFSYPLDGEWWPVIRCCRSWKISTYGSVSISCGL